MIQTWRERPAKRSLGQNFLVDENIARKIVAQLEIGAEDLVLEIGPGPAALTRWLAAAGPRRLVALEKDWYWAGRLKEERPEVEALVADGLEFCWERLRREHNGAGWKVVGNLPYNIASPLMWEIFSRASGLTRAVFMVQREVAERLAARPGNKSYGALSVWVQSFVRPRLAFVVRPQVFRPRPKVDSAVVVFTPAPPPEQSFDLKDLSWLVKRCFQQRRKQLQTILKPLWSESLEAALQDWGLTGLARPEELSASQFQEISRKLGVFPLDIRLKI